MLSGNTRRRQYLLLSPLIAGFSGNLKCLLLIVCFSGKIVAMKYLQESPLIICISGKLGRHVLILVATNKVLADASKKFCPNPLESLYH